MNRTFAAGVIAAAIAGIVTARPAEANYDDVGPLSDVLTVRTFVATFGRIGAENIEEVVVDGDWA